jgi:heptosyltransferase-1
MRLLIVRLSALGDVVTASPVPRLIKRAWPEAEVAWAVEARCAEAVRGHPEVDEVIALPSSRDWRTWAKHDPARALAEAAAVWRRLRARPFDVVLDLQGLAKSALIAGIARAPRKILPADAGEALPFLFTERAPRRLDPRRVASMYVSLLEPLGIRPSGPEDYRLIFPVGEAARAKMAAWRAARGLAAGGYIACAPGTTRPQKHWVAGRWAPLLARLHAACGLPALLLGGPGERDLAAAIAAAAGSPVINAVAQTSLKETAALLESARLTLTVDTGPMHMAVAVGCPTVALFGSTRPRLFGDDSSYRCLHRQFACSPCDRRPICRHFECLEAIRVEDVARAAERLLAGSTGRS